MQCHYLFILKVKKLSLQIFNQWKPRQESWCSRSLGTKPNLLPLLLKLPEIPSWQIKKKIDQQSLTNLIQTIYQQSSLQNLDLKTQKRSNTKKLKLKKHKYERNCPLIYLLKSLPAPNLWWEKYEPATSYSHFVCTLLCLVSNKCKKFGCLENLYSLHHHCHEIKLLF